MRLCQCGEEVEDHVTYHWITTETGHYVVDTQLRHDVSSAYIDGLWGSPPHYAPPPGPKPPKAEWVNEAVLRRSSLELMRSLGWATYDLEQEFRSDGTTRVTPGIGDAYIVGHGLRAWIEFKRWDNGPTEAQVRFARLELTAGGIYLLIYEPAQLIEWHEEVSR